PANGVSGCPASCSVWRSCPPVARPLALGLIAFRLHPYPSPLGVRGQPLPVEIFTADHRQVTLNRRAYISPRIPILSNGKSLGLINIIQKVVDASHSAFDFF